MNITAKTKINMVIGDPVEHSLSPQMHNAGYKALQIDDQFVYVACLVDVNNIEDFINGIRAMNIQGVSCTIPHKLAVIPYIDEIDKIAKKIGAVNTIVNDNDKLIGYNTDWIGSIEPLKKITSLKGKRVALLGAGGAARAAAFAVTNENAHLHIFNRTVENAKKIAEDFGGKASPLDMYEEIKSCDIIINTTAIGLTDKTATPLPKEYITNKHIVFDAVYGHETQLLRDAKEQGAQIIDGTEMLLLQGMAQFKLFTGYDAPEETMREVLK